MKKDTPDSITATSGLSRRAFIKSTAFAAAAAAGFGGSVSAKPSRYGLDQYDAKGLPTTIFGKTGVRLPRMAFGTGSRFHDKTNDLTGPKLLEKALDNGLYYWDCAASYGTEPRLGIALKDRRNEVFLSTKVEDRDVDAARRTIEQSFVNFQTDYIDMYNIHSIQNLSDASSLEPITALLKEYKDAGRIGFIGFSGHSSANAMRYVAQHYDLDAMIIALNHYDVGQLFEEAAVPVAACRGMGVSVIKTIRPRENDPSLTAESLIRYALSLEHVNTAVVGIDGEDVLMENIQLLSQFKPMTETELGAMHLALAPFYRGENLPWMQEKYRDCRGGWC